MPRKPTALPICVLYRCVHTHVVTQTSVSGGPTGRAPDVGVRGRMGRTPDFSVRGTTGPAGVEGEGRAASFELPSPSLSSKKAPSSRLLDLQVGPRLLERLRRTSFLRLPRRRPPRPHTSGPRSAPRPRAPSPAAAPHRRAPRLRAIAAAVPSAPRRDPSPGPAPRRRASRLRATAAAARPRAVAVAAARPRAAARLRGGSDPPPQNYGT